MGESAKGLVALTAQVAGVQAAKKTADLIPLCHDIRLDFADVQLARAPGGVGVHLTSEVACHDATGVEMEALTAVGVGSLSVLPLAASEIALRPLMVGSDATLLIVRIQSSMHFQASLLFCSASKGAAGSIQGIALDSRDPDNHPMWAAAAGFTLCKSTTACLHSWTAIELQERRPVVLFRPSDARETTGFGHHKSARRRFGEEDTFYASAWYKEADEDEGRSDDAENTAFETRLQGGEASTQGGQRELPRTPRLGRSFRASRIQRSWKLWYFRRAFERYSIDCVGFLASLNWLRRHNMLYGIELADPSDTRHWNAAHRTAPKDSEIDPWGHQRLREHLDRIWNIERDARKRVTQGRTEGHSSLVRKRTTPLRSRTAQSGPKVTGLSYRLHGPVPMGERGLAQSLPPPVNRGLGVQASERIPVGGLGPQAWRIPMPRLELGAPRLSFHPSGAVVPFLAGAPPPPVAGRILGCGGPPPTAGGGGFEGARMRCLFSWRPSQIGGAPAGSFAHHLRPIVPGFPVRA
ncbi:molybdenum cofactor biosynthesis protein [Perkinsus olseni]|uniref:Molybdenum cofactor biosynthesis protein n=1 Tax=Perkinsus olseni TaxID=32597 RepID=A0A7J6PK31_PEROL|nr:molybdenum cofactor biosynthesis protein [Perkinsus olseni]